MKPCSKPTPEIGNVDRFIGTSYDVVKFVYENIDSIRTVADHLNLTQGPKGDAPNVTDNNDGTYTIVGANGSVTFSDGKAAKIPYLVDNGDGTITVFDGVGGSVVISSGVKGTKGDTIFQVFQFSEAKIHWHDDLLVTDVYRREATSTNGVIGTWGNAVRMVGQKGDSSHIEYQYSNDNISWHDLLTDNDFFRRQRTVTVSDGVTDYGQYTLGVLMRVDGYTPVKGKDYVDGATGDFTSYILSQWFY